MTPLFAVLVMVICKQCTAVDTVVNALLRSDVVLPCDHGVEKDSVDIAQWFKLPSSTPPIAQKFHDRWNVSPKYNLTTNFSLYIDHVNVDDEARYKCLINPDGYRHDYEGFFQLRLSAYPDKSKSLIEGCGAYDAPCDRTLIAGDSAVVSCWASEVYPETYPQWTTVGSTIDSTTKRTSTKNKDGTFNTSVELSFDVDIMSETELECTLNNGDNNMVSTIRLWVANRTSQVLTSPKETPRPSQFTTTEGGPNSALLAQERIPVNVIVPVIVLIVIIVIVIVVVVLKSGKGIMSHVICCSTGRVKHDDREVGQEHVDYSALPKGENKGSLAPPEQEHVDNLAHPEGEHKDVSISKNAPEQEHTDYSTLPAKTKRAKFHSNRQKTILDDYKLKI